MGRAAGEARQERRTRTAGRREVSGASGTTDLAAVNEAAILNPYLGSPYIVLPLDATVIDIGAYIGDFAVQVARACPRGRIVAVEPVRAHVQMIETQKSLNQVRHIADGARGGWRRHAG